MDKLRKLVRRLSKQALNADFSLAYAKLMAAWTDAGLDLKLLPPKPSRIVRGLWPERREAFWKRVEQVVNGTFDTVAPKPPPRPTSPTKMDVNLQSVAQLSVRFAHQSADFRLEMMDAMDHLIAGLGDDIPRQYRPTFADWDRVIRAYVGGDVTTPISEEDFPIFHQMLALLSWFYGQAAEFDAHLMPWYAKYGVAYIEAWYGPAFPTSPWMTVARLRSEWYDMVPEGPLKSSHEEAFTTLFSSKHFDDEQKPSFAQLAGTIRQWAVESLRGDSMYDRRLNTEDLELVRKMFTVIEMLYGRRKE